MSLPPARGILRPDAGARHFDHARHAPSPALAHLVEHFWSVAWDLEAPYVSETLPHPSVHLTFEPNAALPARAVGVMRGRFTRTLDARGEVFGIKLRPGALRPFVSFPVSEITDRTVPLHDVLGPDADALARAILDAPDSQTRVACAERFFLARLPATDPDLALVQHAVDSARDDRAITRVEHLAEHTGRAPRTLQRLFDRYVGVTPKWVVQRYRLHEATERIAAGERADWARLAAELGYFDQSHFIRDFRALIGTTPAEYAARCAADRR